MNSQYRASIMAVTAVVLSLLPGTKPALGQTPDAPNFTAPSAAKDVFLRPTEGRPSPDRLLALNYTLLLKRGERMIQVPPDYVFQRGDCFRIAVQPNTDGYLYLLHKGSTGAGWFLFPDARIRGGRNDVTAYCEHVVPESGWFEFDENPGSETIHVILASRPLPQLAPLMGTDPIPAPCWRAVVDDFVVSYRQLLTNRGTKDIVYVQPGHGAPEAAAGGAERQAPPTGTAAQPGFAADSRPQGAPASTALPAGVPVAAPANQGSDAAPNHARPAGAPRPPQAAFVQAEAQGIQVFVAQAAAPTGDGKLLVHSICLKHE